jgi:hypothetical protein
MLVTWLLYVFAVYLTYYTFMYARFIWRDGNKTGAVAVGVLAAVFFPLALVIDFMK